MPAIAAWPIVRPVSGAQRNASGTEPLQARVELLADARGREVLRTLTLTLDPRRVDVVAALRREDDLVAVRPEERREHRLADRRLAVHGRGVEERDAAIERGA